LFGFCFSPILGRHIGPVFFVSLLCLGSLCLDAAPLFKRAALFLFFCDPSLFHKNPSVFGPEKIVCVRLFPDPSKLSAPPLIRRGVSRQAFLSSCARIAFLRLSRLCSWFFPVSSVNDAGIFSPTCRTYPFPLPSPKQKLFRHGRERTLRRPFDSCK